MSTDTRKKAVLSATVTANNPVELARPTHNYLITMIAEHPFPAQPGHFVQIRPWESSFSGYPQLPYDDRHIEPWSDVQEDLKTRQTFLNRPFSVAWAQRRGQKTEVSVIYKVIGPGTVRLSTLLPGDRLGLIGPLGRRGFSRDQRLDRAILVAGGIGFPPLNFWARELFDAGVPITFIIAARDKESLPVPDAVLHHTSDRELAGGLFAHLLSERIGLFFATDDGSFGHHGLASEPLEEMLKSRPVDQRWAVFGCGPKPMLKAVAQLTERYEVPCRISLEQIMGCGMGTCQACILKVKSNAEPFWQYKLVCSDGPVFDANEVIWD